MDYTRLITASVIPVVVISASGLLCLAFYNRLAAIVTRLRTFQRERLQAQEARDRAKAAKDTDAVVRAERLIDLLGTETEDVIARARLIRRTLLMFLSAIAALIASSFCCGLTVLVPAFIYAAVATFAAGLLCLFAGVIFALMEMSRSLAPVELESEVVALLAP